MSNLEYFYNLSSSTLKRIKLQKRHLTLSDFGPCLEISPTHCRALRARIVPGSVRQGASENRGVRGVCRGPECHVFETPGTLSGHLDNPEPGARRAPETLPWTLYRSYYLVSVFFVSGECSLRDVKGHNNPHCGNSPRCLVRVGRLQNEVGRKVFFEARICSRKMLRNFPRNF